MKKNKGLLFLFGVLIATALACNLPSTKPTEVPTEGVVEIAATQTSLALTQAALGQNPPSEFTATITQTPTITPTGTLSTPMVSVSVDTNCRTGPGVIYDYLTALQVGEKAEVIGKYTIVSPNYWIIRKGSTTCWLWGQYATVEGNINGLPEMVPPPSPTPTSTNTPTATPTATTVPGDLSIIEVIMKTNFEVAVRVNTNPVDTLNGNFQFIVYSNGAQVKQGNCPVPTGANLCATGYIVSGVESIEVVIDANNSIAESNETNNMVVVNCNKFNLACN